MNIALIGPRGSGKTTIGFCLSETLGWSFLDTDQIIQECSGLSISQVFNLYGEPFFRYLETLAIQEAASKDMTIIATGAGFALNPDSVACLKHNAFIVHLTANPDTLARRVAGDPSTPASRPPVQFDANARELSYANARDAQLAADSLSPSDAAFKIQELLRFFDSTPRRRFLKVLP